MLNRQAEAVSTVPPPWIRDADRCPAWAVERDLNCILPVGHDLPHIDGAFTWVGPDGQRRAGLRAWSHGVGEAQGRPPS